MSGQPEMLMPLTSYSPGPATLNISPSWVVGCVLPGCRDGVRVLITMSALKRGAESPVELSNGSTMMVTGPSVNLKHPSPYQFICIRIQKLYQNYTHLKSRKN